MNFADLDLHPALKAAIDKLGYTTPTDIQKACFEPIVKGRDITGLSQTGTGKTAAFLMPLIQRILLSKAASSEDLSLPKAAEPESEIADGDERPKGVGALPFENWQKHQFILILVPTRELAEQCLDNLNSLGAEANLKGVAIYGGTGYDHQKKLINQGVDFLISTPGRLIDLYKDHVIDLKQARAVVFDEADRMFDMGFKDDMKYLLQRIPEDRQYLCFSATLDFEVLNTAYEFGADPIEIDISKDATKAENVSHEIFHVGHHDKPSYLISIIKKINPQQAIVFTNFKNNVDRVAEFLTRNGLQAQGISSLLNQKQRNKVIDKFKAGEDLHILTATDVAARGLDIKNVDLVINYELPDDAATYVHRIGRTGRADKKGQAYSLVGDRDLPSLKRIEELLGDKIEIGWLEDSEIIKEFKEFPRDERSRKVRDQQDRRKKSSQSGHSGQNGSGPKRQSGPSKYKGNKTDHHSKRSASAPVQAQSQSNPDKTTSEAARPSTSNSKHRDRKSGRHKNKSSFNGANSDVKANSNHQQKRSPSHKPKSGQRVRSSAGRSNPTEAPKSGIGTKVKGFFKNLFN